MAFQFVTAGDYVTRARQLCQDVAGVRYTPDDYFAALNAGILEAYRVRPDFYRDGEASIPQYDPITPEEDINFPKPYAMHLVIFMVGWMELTNSEGTDDTRAAALISAFQQKLKGV